jgi:hypothetical protein
MERADGGWGLPGSFCAKADRPSRFPNGRPGENTTPPSWPAVGQALFEGRPAQLGFFFLPLIKKN